MNIMYNDEYDKNVRNSKIQDVTKKVFNELLNKCNKHNNDEPVFYISLPRNEQLIFDFLFSTVFDEKEVNRKITY